MTTGSTEYNLLFTMWKTKGQAYRRKAENELALKVGIVV